MWFNVFDTVIIYSEGMFDSPMPKHVISTVCSKLKGHNGDPCIVLLWELTEIKMEKLMSDNYFIITAIISINIVSYKKVNQP